MKTEKSLVSIVVITYNSSKYVLETLESAKAQTYKNIELIISDDGSRDDTVKICEEWLNENKEYFKHIELITVKKNTGIPANCNRGVKASNGEWIKLIAGDDILDKKAINEFLNFALVNSSSFVICDLVYFKGNITLTNYGSPKEIKRFFSFESASRKYLSYIRNSVFLNIPSTFYNRKVFDKNDGYDEEFRMIEDIPFIIRTLKNDININYIPKKLVFYRIHEKSATGQGNAKILNDIYQIFIKYKKAILMNGNLLDSIFYYNSEFVYFLKRKGLNRTIFLKLYYKLTFLLRLLS